jgi:hypothetical protein
MVKRYCRTAFLLVLYLYDCRLTKYPATPFCSPEVYVQMKNISETRYTWIKRILFVFFLMLLCLQFFPKRAEAYIDPSTGSLALQVLLGFLVGGIVAIKIFWVKIIAWVKNMHTHQNRNEQIGK